MLQASVSSQASMFDLTLWSNRHLSPPIQTSEQEIRERGVKTRNKIICINKEKEMLLFPACLLLLIFVLCTLSYKQPSQGQTSYSYQKDLIKWN